MQNIKALKKKPEQNAHVVLMFATQATRLINALSLKIIHYM